MGGAQVSRRTSIQNLPNTDRRAEEATLGGMMIDKSQIEPVLNLLMAEDFSDSGLQILFRTIAAMYQAAEIRGMEIDPVLLEARLQRDGYSHTEIADMAQGIANACTNSLSTMEYARIVLGHALERHRQSIGLQLLQGDLTIEEAQEALTRLDMRRKGITSSWQPAVQSLKSLMAKELAEVRWAVEEIIGEGVTLLAAKPKKGKTVLMLQIALCIALGTKALGGYAATVRGEVLYLALEENERRMQRRVRKLLHDATAVPDGVHLVYEWLPFDRGGIEALERWLEEHPNTRLIVIDTLERVRPMRRGNGNIYAEDYAAVKDIQHFAGARGVSVVVIHHAGKRGYEDPLDEVSGSTGLTGGVDNILVMRAANGITELHRMGRDYTDNSVIALRGDAESLLWTYAGEADEVRRSDAQKAILDALQGAPEGMTPAEIADTLGAPANRIRVMLFKMMKSDDGSITKENGRYFAPTNGANGANANPSESPESGKQTDSRGDDRISSSISALAVANGGANGGKVLEFKPDAYIVSDISAISGTCQVTGGAHEYNDIRRDAKRRRVCVECQQPEASVGA
jgi:AAA domain-containing protein/DnaB helicase-like protein